MMIPWWYLLLIVPSCVFLGFTLMACCAAAATADFRTAIARRDKQIADRDAVISNLLFCGGGRPRGGMLILFGDGTMWEVSNDELLRMYKE